MSTSNPLFSLFALWGAYARDNTYEHWHKYVNRTESVDALVLMLETHSPWQVSEKWGIAPVDLIFSMDKPNAADLWVLMHACLTHKDAPPPETWAHRPTLVRPPKENAQTAVMLPWLHAWAKHPSLSDYVEQYTKLGGTLNALDHRGLTALSYLAHSECLERWFACAQQQNVDLCGLAPNASWVMVWRNEFDCGVARLRAAQENIKALQEKYPVHSMLSAQSKKDFAWQEWLALVQAGNLGQRALNSALQRLELEEDFKNNAPRQRDTLNALISALVPQGSGVHWSKNTQGRTLGSGLDWLTKWFTKHVHPDVHQQFMGTVALLEAFCQGRFSSPVASVAQGTLSPLVSKMPLFDYCMALKQVYPNAYAVSASNNNKRINHQPYLRDKVANRMLEHTSNASSWEEHACVFGAPSLPLWQTEGSLKIMMTKWAAEYGALALEDVPASALTQLWAGVVEWSAFILTCPRHAPLPDERILALVPEWRNVLNYTEPNSPPTAVAHNLAHVLNVAEQAVILNPNLLPTNWLEYASSLLSQSPRPVAQALHAKVSKIAVSQALAPSVAVPTRAGRKM